MMEEYLGLDFKDRQLKEVNYNSEEFEAYYSSVLATSSSGEYSVDFNVVGNTKVAAIDAVLTEYGLSNDADMVEYAHKVAYLESAYGVNIYNPDGGGMGAQGIYQTRLPSVSGSVSSSSG